MDNEPSQETTAPANEGAAIQQGNAPQDNGGAGDTQTSGSTTQSSNTGATTGADTTTAGFSAEQLAEMKKFFDNNGGFEAVKSKLSNPQKQPEPQTQQVQQSQPQQPQMQQPEPAKVPDGYRTPQEMNLNRYLNDLANSSQYEPIREYIEKDNGKEFFGDLKAFNIPVMDDAGNINVDGINRWLGVKLQTVPAKQPAGTPSESSAPTVDYVQVGEEIKNAAEAEAVIRQTAALKAQGLAPHPANAKAVEFLKKQWGGKR